MVETRRDNLLEIVRSQGYASLPDLAEALHVSESTVRRDLDHLESKGQVRRSHGGAFYSGPSPHLAHFHHRQSAEWGKKKAIAKASLPLVAGVDTLLLDGGTTTYELARLLIDAPRQIVTNSLPVANLFSSRPEIELILIGGYLQSTTGVLLGPYTEEMLSSLRVHTAVISAAGVVESGLYNSNHMTAATQQAMVKAADEVILVADSTKFGRHSIAPVCDLEEVDHAVVDHEISPTWKDCLTQAGVTITIAQPLATNNQSTDEFSTTTANLTGPAT